MKVISQVDADGNATLTLNRPEVHNAFDPEMVDALTAELKRLEANEKVRAIVVTGAGRNFCAGADIEQMRRTAKASREQNLENARATSLMLETLHALGKPTIRSEEHTSELQSQSNLVCRLLLEKKKKK